MRQFAVHEVGTVAEACCALESVFDWVLLDLMLPDGSGTEVLRRIKSERVPTKVCIISGCCPEMFNEARAGGADEALVKPVDVDYLLNLLSTDTPIHHGAVPDS